MTHKDFGTVFYIGVRQESEAGGYILNKRDYHHAIDSYRRKQVLRTEQDEMNNRED